MRVFSPRTVVVTGVSGYWGRSVARLLLGRPGLRVLGIDRRPLGRPMRGLDFVKADVRNPLLVDLLRVENVDAVVHLAVANRQWRDEQTFESNVLGTMQLVGACADAGVRQVVLKSTMAVYGATPDSSMYVAEDTPLAARSTYASIREALEIETWVRDFSAEYPEMRIAILRFANIAGIGAGTPFSRLLSLPAIPELLGFDPLLQVIDAEDAAAALAHAVVVEAQGPFNVAGDGVVSLCQLAGLLGRPLLPIFHLAVYWGWPALSSLPLGRRALAWFPIEPDYLRYPWTGNLGRMWDVLGFEPAYDARQAIEQFVRASRIQRYRGSPERQRFAEDQLDDEIDRRGWTQGDQDDLEATGRA